jgi:hypothetical protein
MYICGKMFTFNGRKWISDQTEWTDNELAALYYSLWSALERTEDIEVRTELVYLIEKLFNETETIELWKSD